MCEMVIKDADVRRLGERSTESGNRVASGTWGGIKISASQTRNRTAHVTWAITTGGSGCGEMFGTALQMATCAGNKENRCDSSAAATAGVLFKEIPCHCRCVSMYI
jgi:hypothetical protein